MMSRITEELTFTVPLSFEAHSLAQHLSKPVGDRQQAKQVYLNTLAVYAVDFYLRCMGFGTNWFQSDSRNPVMLAFMDVADLDVKHLGKIECRPVLPEAEICAIPPEVWSDRIGYVAVRFDRSLKQATLLGFAEKAAKEIHLSQLQSLEKFTEFLSQKRQSEPVNLGEWFAGIIDAGWLAIEQLLNLEQVELAFMFRDAITITRGQQIDLGMELGEQSLALLVMLPSEPDSEVDIRVQVHPMKGQSFLPPGVKLIVMDESGEAVLDTESREADNFIQLHFSAELGERFSVAVALGNTSVKQDFCL